MIISKKKFRLTSCQQSR